MSYNKKIWANGDLITKEGMNNIEYGIYDAHDKINTINNKVEENTTDTNTARQDISDIKLQIGTEELTTKSKKIKGAINDLSSQIKDIENEKINKIDLDYINVLDLGIKPEANFDNTPLFDAAINKGIKNFYFPTGTYELNLTISIPYIKIKGDGVGLTIFNPHVDKDVINIKHVDNSLYNCEIYDLQIKNMKSGFTNCNGLSITGSNKGVYAINDFHYFKNLRISDCLNGILIEDRTICSRFENLDITRNNNNGIRVQSTDTTNCVNSNSFYNICITNNVNEGLYIDATRKSTNFDSIPLVNNFINCDIESNAISSNTTRFYGVYVTDADNINFQGCYVENNAMNSDDGAAFCFDGTFCRGLGMRGNLIWGSKYAIKVTDRCVILSGEISSSNKITGIIDINDNVHETESGLIIGCTLTEGYDNVKKLKPDLLKNTSTTLNPFSIGIVHDHTSTPDVKRTNYITTFDSHEITNFINGMLGQIVIVRPYGSATLTFNNGTYIKLKDENTCTIKAGQTITFMKYGDEWVELFRNV